MKQILSFCGTTCHAGSWGVFHRPHPTYSPPFLWHVSPFLHNTRLIPVLQARSEPPQGGTQPSASSSLTGGCLPNLPSQAAEGRCISPPILGVPLCHYVQALLLLLLQDRPSLGSGNLQKGRSQRTDFVTFTATGTEFSLQVCMQLAATPATVGPSQVKEDLEPVKTPQSPLVLWRSPLLEAPGDSAVRMASVSIC